MENLVWFRQIGSWPSALPKSEISSHSRSASYRRWEISRNGGKSLIPAPSLLHCSTGGEYLCVGRQMGDLPGALEGSPGGGVDLEDVGRLTGLLHSGPGLNLGAPGDDGPGCGN